MKSVTVHRATRSAAAISVSLTLFPAKTINTGNRYSTYSYSRATEFIETVRLIRYFFPLNSFSPPFPSFGFEITSFFLQNFMKYFPTVKLIFHRVSKGREPSSPSNPYLSPSVKNFRPLPRRHLVFSSLSVVSSENRNAIYNSSVAVHLFHRFANLFFKTVTSIASRLCFFPRPLLQFFFSRTHSDEHASSTFFEGKDRDERETRPFSLIFFVPPSGRNVDKRPTSRKFSRVPRPESLEENRHNIGIIILSDRWQRMVGGTHGRGSKAGCPFHLAPVIRPPPFHEPSGLWHFEFLFLSPSYSHRRI